MMFDCASPGPSIESKTSSEYITAQIHVRHVATEMNFTVGDGLHYGGFYNAPLENGRNYYIILRAVSQWKTVGETTEPSTVKCINRANCSRILLLNFLNVFSLRL